MDKDQKKLHEFYFNGAFGPQGSGQPKPSIMSPDTKNIDDLDTPPIFNLDDPQTLKRVRFYVKQVNGVTENPWRMIKNVHYKLHISGINFQLPTTELLPTESTIYQFDLLCHGGVFGPNVDGSWENGSGFDNDFVIQFEISPTGDGYFTIDADILREDDIMEYSDEEDDNDEEIFDDLVVQEDSFELTEDESKKKALITHKLTGSKQKLKTVAKKLGLSDDCSIGKVNATLNRSSGKIIDSVYQMVKEDLDRYEQDVFEYIENDRKTYDRSFIPAVRLLMSKISRGSYRRSDAIKAFQKVVSYGINRYIDEFGANIPDSFDADYDEDAIDSAIQIQNLSMRQRLAIAGEMTDSFEVEANYGNYDNSTFGGYSAEGYFDDKRDFR